MCRDNAWSRVFVCRWHRVRSLGTISASIQHRYTPEGNRSQTRHNLSLIASSPSARSLSLFPSLARARGIKYNKDIQWELIGDISTYLPFTRGALLPPVHNVGMRRRCRDARFASLPPLYVPFLSTPLCLAFFFRRRPNRDIFRGGIISATVTFLAGVTLRRVLDIVALRCVAPRRRTPPFPIYLPTWQPVSA